MIRVLIKRILSHVTVSSAVSAHYSVLAEKPSPAGGIYPRAYLSAYLPVCGRAYLPAYVPAYLPANGRVYLSAYVPAYTPAYGRVHLPAYGTAYLSAYLPAHGRVYLSAHGRVYVPAYPPAYGTAYLPAYVPAHGMAYGPARGSGQSVPAAGTPVRRSSCATLRSSRGWSSLRPQIPSVSSTNGNREKRDTSPISSPKCVKGVRKGPGTGTLYRKASGHLGRFRPPL